MTDPANHDSQEGEANRKRGKKSTEALNDAAVAQLQLLRLLMTDALAVLRGAAQGRDCTDTESLDEEDK